LLVNRKAPKLGTIMDDVPAAQQSIDRLRSLAPGTVYPGHGAPFEFAQLGG
jgi:glyoxylase-like metal-dependent hydrolase (beta-lactamase superfamily II)